MDTRFLESFLVFTESGSIAAAARRLDLTPAALTQRIRALEEELGVKLLARSGQRVHPTAAGRAMIERAQGVLRETRALRAAARSDAPMGQLRLGAISTALTGVLPPILKTLATRHPELDMYIMPGTSIDLYQKVLSGELDAAVIVKPPFELPKASNWTLLRKEPLVVIAPADSRIGDPMTLLATEPFIRYDRGHWGGRLADAYLRKSDIAPRERLELDALDAIAILVSRGLGVSLVPDWAPPWPERLSLRKLPIEAPAFDRSVGLLWMRDSGDHRLVRLLQAEIRRQARARSS